MTERNAEHYEVTLTFLDSAPWWDKLLPEEWAAMSDKERLLTKMAIDSYRVVPLNPNNLDVHVAEFPGGTLLRSGDSVTATFTIS